jgi:hypothetical protein
VTHSLKALAERSDALAESTRGTHSRALKIIKVKRLRLTFILHKKDAEDFGVSQNPIPYSPQERRRGFWR